MLTPEDLKKKTFSKGFRGYETAEVDKFMQELIKEYNYLYLDNLQQKETIERVSSKLEYYQQMEATMQSTLTVAQETADEVKAASEKKAALLEQETTVKCEQQLAEAKGRKADFDFYNRVERLAPEVINSKRKIYKGVSTNVDFYSGFVYNMLDIPVELYTPMFAIARIVGWSAHRMEELVNVDKIIRPAYKSVMEPRPYVALEDR